MKDDRLDCSVDIVSSVWNPEKNGKENDFLMFWFHGGKYKRKIKYNKILNFLVLI